MKVRFIYEEAESGQVLSSKYNPIYSTTRVLQLIKMTKKASCTKPCINIKLLMKSKVQMS